MVNSADLYEDVEDDMNDETWDGEEQSEEKSSESRGNNRTRRGNNRPMRPRKGPRGPRRNSGPPPHQQQWGGHQGQQWQPQPYGGRGYNQQQWGPPPPPPGGYYGPPQNYGPPQQGYYPQGPNPRHVARQQNYQKAVQQEKYAECVACGRWLLRNEMKGINVRVYHQGGPHEKIQFRFCSECHEEWVEDFREHQWENDLRDREDVPEGAEIIESKGF